MQKKSSENTTNTPPRRKLINIGPGLILALLISLFIGGRWYMEERAARQQPPAPPIIERQVISSSADQAGPTPEVNFILAHKAKLNLTATQATKLEQLQAQWQKFCAPRLAQASAAAAKTNDYLDQHKDDKRLPAAQVQDQAAPLIAISGELAAARHRYWNQATALLTPQQRTTLQAERAVAWTAQTKRAPTR